MKKKVLENNFDAKKLIDFCEEQLRIVNLLETYI